MCSMINSRKILGVLVDNIACNRSPALVTCAAIAEKLDMSLTETRETMRSMRSMGVIESDEDMQHALITRQGLHFFYETNYSGQDLLSAEVLSCR